MTAEELAAPHLARKAAAGGANDDVCRVRDPRPSDLRRGRRGRRGSPRPRPPTVSRRRPPAGSGTRRRRLRTSSRTRQPPTRGRRCVGRGARAPGGLGDDQARQRLGPGAAARGSAPRRRSASSAEDVRVAGMLHGNEAQAEPGQRPRLPATICRRSSGSRRRRSSRPSTRRVDS